jgi:cytochrome c biogenesis protein
MFYIRERRLWVWVKDADNPADGAAAGAHVLMAMSTPRKTLDFEREFGDMRRDLQQAAGAANPDQPADDSTASNRTPQ